MLLCILSYLLLFFFFFNDTATTEIYTLSLHDALPICTACASTTRYGRRRALSVRSRAGLRAWRSSARGPARMQARRQRDRKSTRLNSSHSQISYAVFCLKKKKTYILTISRVRVVITDL